MTPRFLADADFNHKIVLGLRRREPAIDFWDARRAGVIGVPDSEVLRIAADDGRILVAHDRKTMPKHFGEFIASRSYPGVLIVSKKLPISSVVDHLLLIWAAAEAEEWENIIVSLPL